MFSAGTWAELVLVEDAQHPRFGGAIVVAMALARVPPLVSALNIPEAYVQEWLSGNVTQSATLVSLAQLEYRERVKVIRKTMELHRKGEVRCGIDNYLQGCVRKRSSESASQSPPAKSRRNGSAGAEDCVPRTGATVGYPTVPFAAAAVSDRQECSGCAASPALVSATMPMSTWAAPPASASPPDWVADLMRGEVDRCRIVRAVSERCAAEVCTQLCAIDPFLQFAVCAGIVMDPSKWESPSLAVADFCARYDIMLAVIAAPVAAAAPVSPPRARLVVFAVGVGMGAAAPAVLAAIGKWKQSEPGSPFPVEVVEVSGVHTNSVSDEYDVAVIPRVTFPVLMFGKGNDHLDIVRKRMDFWEGHPRAAGNAALLIGVESDSNFCSAAMLEAADLLVAAGLVVEMVVFRRCDDGDLPALDERFGCGMWQDAARFRSPARPWFIHRSALPADSEWGPTTRDIAVPLSAASQSRPRVQPAAAPPYRPGEYLPSYTSYRSLVMKLLWKESLTMREQVSERLLFSAGRGATRRLLTREALLKIHGFEQWPQGSVVNELCKCEGTINPSSGIAAPAGAAGSQSCGMQRHCIPCEMFYGACDSSPHAGLFVCSLVLPIGAAVYRVRDRCTSKQARA